MRRWIGVAAGVLAIGMCASFTARVAAQGGATAGLAQSASAAQGSATLPADMRAKIDEAAQQVLVSLGVPSASIAVVRDGEIAYTQAYGKATIDPPVAARPDMPYSVGSISKQFTATAMLMLVEEGKVSLDDPVSRWLPDLTRAKEVTVREILSHTSGYQDYWPQDYVMPSMTQPTTAQKIMDTWAKKPLDYEPGTRYQYSNTGYVIAGAIVEKASGMPLLQFLREHVFKPLGMESIVDVNMGRLPQTAPTGYMRFALGPPRPATKEGPGWLFAAGELAMTARDLARWDIGTIDQKLLKPASYKVMQTEVRRKDGVGVGYGLGVGVSLIAGHRAITHDGEVSGFTSANQVFPDDRAAIVVLTNQDSNGAASHIAGRIREIIFASDSAESAKAAERAEKILEGLQHGTIDRSEFSDNCNAYFNDQALKDFASSLGSLGVPRDITMTGSGLRGGMKSQDFRVRFATVTIVISEYELPDGKLDQFEVEPAN
jgi:CubicO group peptidase (beta-lactamase class C family)